MKKIILLISCLLITTGCNVINNDKTTIQDKKIIELQKEITELEKEQEIINLENKISKLKKEKDTLENNKNCLIYENEMLKEVKQNKTINAKIVEIFYSSKTNNCYYVSDVGGSVYFLNDYTNNKEITMVACGSGECYKTAWKNILSKLNNENITPKDSIKLNKKETLDDDRISDIDNSIIPTPEEELEGLYKKYLDLNISTLNNFIEKNNFEKDGFKSGTKYTYSMMNPNDGDISPMPRIFLIFDVSKLVAIVHKEKINIPAMKSKIRNGTYNFSILDLSGNDKYLYDIIGRIEGAD